MATGRIYYTQSAGRRGRSGNTRIKLMTLAEAKADAAKKAASSGRDTGIYDRDDYLIDTVRAASRASTKKREASTGTSYIVMRRADQDDSEGWPYDDLTEAMTKVVEKEALGFEMAVVQFDGDERVGVIYP